MLTLPEICRSRYLLYRGLTDAGFPATRAALAVDALLGPEPDEFIPSPEDWASYCEWSDRLDRDGWRLDGDDPGYVSDRDVLASGVAVG